MTTLPEFLQIHGCVLEPLEEPSLRSLDPGDGWRLVEQNEPVGNAAVWVHPGLGREGFQPTVVVSTARIRPAVDCTTVLDRLADTAAVLGGWRLRATQRVKDDRGRWVADTLGEFRVGDHELTASTIATVWRDDGGDSGEGVVSGDTACESGGGATVLRQVVVTTFADQLTSHAEVLRALD